MIIRNPSYTRVKNIPEYVFREAELRAENQRVFEKSHRKDEANSVGCLGEVIAEYWMKQNNIPYTPDLEKTTHDYLVGNGLTIDVKAKDRTVTPRIYYDNSAPLYNHTHQRPDYFLFISLERSRSNKTKDVRRFHTAHILGSISYEEIDKVGIPFLEGEADWRNGTIFWTDCLNVEMWQLVPLQETIKIFKGDQIQPNKKASLNQKVINVMQELISKGKYRPRQLPIINNS